MIWLAGIVILGIIIGVWNGWRAYRYDLQHRQLEADQPAAQVIPFPDRGSNNGRAA